MWVLEGDPSREKNSLEQLLSFLVENPFGEKFSYHFEANELWLKPGTIFNNSGWSNGWAILKLLLLEGDDRLPERKGWIGISSKEFFPPEGSSSNTHIPYKIEKSKNYKKMGKMLKVYRKSIGFCFQ